MTTRALFAIRLSSLTDSSTSPERQLEHCSDLTKRREWEHVGTAEDLDISATKYSPFDRPELGDWLNNRAHEFDVIVFWRFDRIARSSADIAGLIEWCKKNGKNIVSATEPFDTTDPFGEAMITIIVALAQLEARTTSLRVQDMHDSLKTTDRLAAGVPPFGFRPIPHPSGKGVTYERDPDMQEVLHELAAKLMEGETLTGLTRWMTENKIMSAWDRSRVRNGKEPKYAPWQVPTVKALLSSPATQGFKMTGGARRGQPVMTDDGQFIRVAPPTFDDATWEQIQEKLKERTNSGTRRVNSDNPLLGVGKCGECGASLSQNFNRQSPHRPYRYYRCAGTGIRRCTNVSISAHRADAILEAAFLSAKGSEKVKEKVFIPGTDNRVEIDNLRAGIRRLKRESDAGLIDDEDEYINRLTVMTSRLRELEKEPYRASRWEDRETSKTYAEEWENADVKRRRELLQNSEATFYLFKGQGVHLDFGVHSPHGPTAAIGTNE